MAKTKKKAKAKTKARSKPKAAAISLKDTVNELHKVHVALQKVHGKAEGQEKEDLALTIKSVTDIHQSLVDTCHGAFPVYVPSKPGGKS